MTVCISDQFQDIPLKVLHTLKLLELHKGAKRLQCSSDFMNKIAYQTGAQVNFFFLSTTV